MNRRGDTGNQVMFVVYLFLLVMISGGIVIGNLMFFGSGYDGRQLDADVLNYKVRECIRQNVLTDIKNDFYGVCHFRKDVLGEEKYKVNICEGECVGDSPGIISVGSNFASCKLTGKGEEYPKCTISHIMKDGKSYEVISGSSQLPRGISE